MIMSSMALAAALMSKPAVMPQRAVPSPVAKTAAAPVLTTGASSSGMRPGRRGGEQQLTRCYDRASTRYSENLNRCREELTFRIVDCYSEETKGGPSRCVAMAYRDYSTCTLLAQRRFQRQVEDCNGDDDSSDEDCMFCPR